jgi:hypothetical protein
MRCTIKSGFKLGSPEAYLVDEDHQPQLLSHSYDLNLTQALNEEPLPLCPHLART